MSTDNKPYYPYRSRAIRAIFLSIAYYLFVFINIFMLKDKIDIKNWDVLYLFLPLIILGVSTESLLFDTLTTRIVKIFAYMDLVSKGIGYLFHSLIIRHVLIGPWYYVGLSLVILSTIYSIICNIVMIAKG